MSAVVRPREAGESVGLIVVVLWTSRTLSSLVPSISSPSRASTSENGSHCNNREQFDQQGSWDLKAHQPHNYCALEQVSFARGHLSFEARGPL